MTLNRPSVDLDEMDIFMCIRKHTLLLVGFAYAFTLSAHFIHEASSSQSLSDFLPPIELPFSSEETESGNEADAGIMDMRFSSLEHSFYRSVSGWSHFFRDHSSLEAELPVPTRPPRA